MTQVSVSVPILSKNSCAASPNSGLLVIMVSSFFLSTRNLCSCSNCWSHSLLMSSRLLSRDKPDPQSSIMFIYLRGILTKLLTLLINTCCLYCSRPCAPGELRGVADNADGEDDHGHDGGAAGEISGDDCSPGDTGAEAGEVPSLSSSRHLILHRL